MDWDWKYLFTSFDGRINRAKYWGAALAFGIPAFLIQMLLFWVLGFIITTIVSLVFLYPTYALLLKRGNDRDRPAWITQAFIGVLAITNILQAVIGPSVLVRPPMFYTAVSLIMGIFALYILVDYGCLRGTVGPNQHGPDPLGNQPQA